MVHPSLVEDWLNDQEKQRAKEQEEAPDRNRKQARPGSAPLPNSDNRRGRRRRPTEPPADASKHEAMTAPRAVRRSTRIARAANNPSIAKATPIDITQSSKRFSVVIPSRDPSIIYSGFAFSESSKRTRISVGAQRKALEPKLKEPSRAAIYFNMPGAHLTREPEDVLEFTERFSELVLNVGYIPEELKSALRERYPEKSFADHYFSPKPGTGIEILEKVEKFVGQSRGLSADASCEGDWVRLTHDILTAFGTEENPDFAVRDVTAGQLNKALYPTLQSSKIDLALTFNSKASVFFKQISTFPEDTPLSAFSHQSLKDTIAFLGVEIKSLLCQSSVEAETQLGIWAAKTGKVYLDWVAYSRRRSEGQDSGSIKIKPIIGVTVLGSSWSYYIAYLAPDREFTNTYVLLGKYEIANTSTIPGIFKIAKFLCLVRDWSVKELWPWCVELLGEKAQAEQVEKHNFAKPARPIRQTRSSKVGKAGKAGRPAKPGQSSR